MSPSIKPTIFTTPFAANGEKTLPPLVQSAEGRASLNDGFPVETQLPIRAGGLPPMRADFNGALNLTTEHDVFQLMGGRYTFETAVAAADGYPKGVELYFSNPAMPLKLRSMKDNNKDDFNTNPGYIGQSWAIVGPGLIPWNDFFVFSPPCIAFGSDGKLYQCLQTNGPGTDGGVRVPEENKGYWERLIPDTKPDQFVIGEFYYFRHPTIKPGFAAAQGGLISGAYQGKNITEYPIWAYLQTAEGQLLCKSEAQWQAMTTATWHTNADGSKIGWDGIGGAPFYVQDLSAGTLRMPDLRGMYAEAAGFASLGVGDVQGDGERRKSGKVSLLFPGGFETSTTAGVFKTSGARTAAYGTASSWGSLEFDNAGSVPIATKTQPRSWGALACAYLGQPAS